MNFVFVSLQRINTDRESTSTSLAKELAKNHQVLYINPAIDRKTYHSSHKDSFIKAHIQQIKEKKAGLNKLAKHLWELNPKRILESVNWIPFTPIFSVFNWINNRRMAAEIKKAASQLGFDSYILINDKDIFRSFYLKELLKPKLYIYLDRDYTIGFGYWKRHGVPLEPRLMQKADGVVCNSIDFTKNAAKHNPNSFYIGNGCDLELFDIQTPLNKPEILKNIAEPIIGYVGALQSMRLDIPLMVAMAKAKPAWSFVLAGEEDEPFKNSLLHQLPNVHFLGKIHKREIPAFMKYFDVCINPQLINEITIGNFPLKIVEYLAMGKPVVATATNTMKEVFITQTHLAITLEEYLQNIEKALTENTAELQEERVKFVQQYTWENVTDILIEAINKISVSPKA
ncbi:MAG: glycosyltransferase [Sphingobacteriaceae bacterium]